MNWQDLAKGLAKVGLPTLGTAVGGPLGGMVGAEIARRLGSDATPEAISETMAVNPDAMIRLREIDKEIADRAAQHDEAMLATATADVQDARASAKDDTVRRWLAGPSILGPLMFGGWFLWAQPADPGGIAMFLLGMLAQQAGQVFTFYFGTSLGSVKKSKELARK